MNPERHIVDFHTHCWTDTFGPRLIDYFFQSYPVMGRVVPKISHDGTIASLLASMDAAGVDISVLLPVATKVSQVKLQNDWTRQFLASDRIVPFGAIYPGQEDVVKTVHDLARAGYKGIKLHPLDQGFLPQDESMFPLYEAAMDDGLIVLFHAGVDFRVPDDKGCSPEDFAELFARYPYERFVLAHLGGRRDWESLPIATSGRPGYIDCACCLNHIPGSRIVECIRAHGADHVLFGTDAPWEVQRDAVDRFLDLPLTEGEKEAILYGNAAQLLGLPGITDSVLR